jgi:hypothetical protein
MGNGMTHREFCQKGGAAKSKAKLRAANHNLAKAQAVRKAQLAAKTMTAPATEVQQAPINPSHTYGSAPTKFD